MERCRPLLFTKKIWYTYNLRIQFYMLGGISAPGKDIMTRQNAKDEGSHPLKREDAYRALYTRSVYDAYYLAQGLLGGRSRSLEAVEEAFRRVKTKLAGLSEAEQDNLLLQQVVDVCRSRADNAFLQDESGADYIALMSMPMRARQVLMLADMLHLPDAIIAQVMHSRKDRVARSLKEARADLVRRAATALGPHETVEKIIERTVEVLTPQMVQGLWTRLGGRAEQMSGWSAPDMRGAVRKNWPLAVALAAALAVLMALVVMLTRGSPAQPGQSQAATAALEETAAAPTRTPTTLTVTPASTEPTYEVVLTLGGDTVLGGLPDRDHRDDSFAAVTGNESTYPFAGLLPILSRDDLTILNLECALTDRSVAQEDQDYPFKGRPDAANMLVAGSVEAVTLENSHSMDYGERGYEDTKEALETAGIQWADGENLLCYDTEQGIRIGIAALKDPITTENLADAIEELKRQGAKFIVLSLHWGEELAETPSQEQQELARKAIDLGADVIMGHHAHVVQTMEVYQNRPIFYSLGNVVYGGSTNPTDWDIALARIILECQQGEVVKVKWMAIPGSVSGEGEENNYQPQVYAPGTADAIRVYGKLGMSHTQLAGWKRLYDELWPSKDGTQTTAAQAE